MDDVAMIEVEVAYALPEKQKILTVQVEEGSTILQAVQQSPILEEFPELNLDEAKFGIFGKASRAPQTDTVRDGDRIEIYRPLLIDPKQARANRAAKTKK
ncbi:RnfH family protein [Bacterioplanoides sp. SCSIO 12839]|uniref:RnfH family protein n=1 Tax=Bacterioplanoides sp. SCSIO 12839 TaxID=2829569 RepID=UPI002101F08A|nr:RnfH family protein [Bacterioplanoides sp. SCSIO 12839]UTW47663.1 RnfH family protein [Bacterioplanoides sp. SCSIO 12839]